MIQINCQSCNGEPLDGDNFCRDCGTELPEPDTFECPECDAEVYEEDKFCFSCGTKFDGLVTEEETEESQEQVCPPSAFGQPQPSIQQQPSSGLPPQSSNSFQRPPNGF